MPILEGDDVDPVVDLEMDLLVVEVSNNDDQESKSDLNDSDDDIKMFEAICIFI
jgi:hypothetical protein